MKTIPCDHEGDGGYLIIPLDHLDRLVLEMEKYHAATIRELRQSSLARERLPLLLRDLQRLIGQMEREFDRHAVA